MDPQLKQRLVGALVLVALAVLIVPVWLDGGYHDRSTQQRDMAPMPADQFGESIAPVPVETIAEIDAGMDAAPPALAVTALENSSPPPSLVPPADPSALPASASPLSAPPPAKVKAAAALETPGRWAVQLGSFTSRENAELLLQRLRLTDTAGHIVAVKEPYGMTFRVRAGPLDDHAAAVELRDRLARTAALRGILVRE
ncbi:MAG: SPOR domain-containing protein [Gammaproteobacteria bacterium]|nr:SPOR domain-containing protein [Gammaproteobacteria bacterium]